MFHSPYIGVFVCVCVYNRQYGLLCMFRVEREKNMIFYTAFNGFIQRKTGFQIIYHSFRYTNKFKNLPSAQSTLYC